jgi:predicted NBD/HSP70 family sugar kinase
VEAALVELADRALHGNAAARQVLDTMVRGVLKACEDIALLLDLDHVVFGGPHWTTLAPFFSTERLAELQRRHGMQSIHPLTTSGTRIGEDVGAVGAASLVLDHTFSTNPAVLLAS